MSACPLRANSGHCCLRDTCPPSGQSGHDISHRKCLADADHNGFAHDFWLRYDLWIALGDLGTRHEAIFIVFIVAMRFLPLRGGGRTTGDRFPLYQNARQGGMHMCRSKRRPYRTLLLRQIQNGLVLSSPRPRGVRPVHASLWAQVVAVWGLEQA